MTVTAQSTTSHLAEFLRDQAGWRAEKAEQYPEDDRNKLSSEALESLADWVEQLPDDHAGLVALRAATRRWPSCVDWDLFWSSAPGEESQRLVSRYGFGFHQSPEPWLTDLAAAVEADRLFFEREDGLGRGMSESQLRRRAAKAGYRLTKSRAAISLDNYGRWMLVDAAQNFVVAGERFDLTDEDVVGWVA